MATMSATERKALNILQGGHVKPQGVLPVYQVKDYVVVLCINGHTNFCSCPATVECSHIKAAITFAGRQLDAAEGL